MLAGSDMMTKCGQVIRKSKYEQQSLDSYNWWIRLFQFIETEAAIPSHKRDETLQEIFPEKLLKKILSILHIKAEEVKLCTTFLSTPQLSRVRKSTSTINVQKRSRDSHQSAHLKIGKEKFDTLDNPYLNFFKKNPERVAIWRDVPPLKIDEMDLCQRAEALTEIIAEDFIEWILRLSGTTELDVGQIMKMFEIGVNMHAATSLQTIVKEMPAVTNSVSEARELPERSYSQKLQEKLRNDLSDFAKPIKITAFGTTLPRELRRDPQKTDHIDKWLLFKPPEKLKSMAAVWEGITGLRSTRAFCQWLIDHPHVPPPKYLNDLGMINPEFFQLPHYELDI